MPAPAAIPGITSAGPALYPFDAQRTPPQFQGGTGGAPVAALTKRYVRTSGSDSNGGTTPADAWLTVNKALTTASPGTAIYVGAGVYRGVISVTITPTNTLPVSVIGDVDGLVTGDAGMVQLTAYTTNDRTAPSSTALLDLNSKSNMTFQNIMFVGGNGSAFSASATGNTSSQNITLRDCAFLAGGTGNQNLVSLQSAPGQPLNWLIDRCLFVGGAGGTLLIVTAFTSASSGGDYDLNFVVQNCRFFGGTTSINGGAANSLAFRGGGIKVRNCSFFWPTASAVATNSANYSLKVPMLVTGCHIQASQALNANTLGQIVEDYNLIVSPFARTSVSVGPHSVSNGSYAPLFHAGQEQLWGGTLRPLGEPMQSSPLRAFGAVDTAAGAFDVRSGSRPSAAVAWDVGAFQRGGSWTQETSVLHTGSNALRCVSAGFQDFDIPVDATLTTVSVYLRYDGTYAGPLPQLQVLANQQVGVAAQTIAASTASLNAYSQVSASFTPTGNGIVTVRLVSSDTSTTGVTYADSFSVT